MSPGFRLIIRDELRQFMNANPNFVLYQDNDSKHGAGICTEALDEYNIRWVFLNVSKFYIFYFNIIFMLLDQNSFL